MDNLRYKKINGEINLLIDGYRYFVFHNDVIHLDYLIYHHIVSIYNSLIVVNNLYDNTHNDVVNKILRR